MSHGLPDDGRTPVQAVRTDKPHPWSRALVWLRFQWQLLKRPRIESGWASMCGTSHSRNQDAVFAMAPFFAVADGVGGGSAGELASSQMLAWCRTIPRSAWKHSESLAEWLRQADDAIAESLQAVNPHGVSATTFAGVWLSASGRGNIAHVGDARVLLLRPTQNHWKVEQLTRDQTYAEMGEAPPAGGSPGDPARMVGVGAIGEPPVAKIHLFEAECLLLCSDGFHRFVLPERIAAFYHQSDGTYQSLSQLATQLALAAQASGSHDDVSVLLVRRNPRFGARQRCWVALLATMLFGLAAFSWGGSCSAVSPECRELNNLMGEEWRADPYKLEYVTYKGLDAWISARIPVLTQKKQTPRLMAPPGGVDDFPFASK